MSDETRTLLESITPDFAHEHGDWQRVLGDAARLDAAALTMPRERRVRVPRNRSRRIVLGLLAALAIAAPLAVAARTTHLLDFAFGSSPPKAVRQLFLRSLPHDVGPKDGPPIQASQKDLIRSSERLVDQFTTRSGKVARMYAADLRTGGECIIALGGPFNGGTCRFGPAKARYAVLASSGSWGSPPHGSFGNRVTIFGRALSPRASAIVFRYKDGTDQMLTLNHGWFMFEVPRAHEVYGHQPTRIDVVDVAGATVATQADPFGLVQLKLPKIERPIPATERTLVREPLGWRGAFVELQDARGDRGSQCMRVYNTLDHVQTRSWTCRSIAKVTFIGRGKIAPLRPVTFELPRRTVTDGKPGGYLYARGWVGAKVASLELRFQDSTVVTIPLHDRLFVYVVPPARWVRGKRPSYVVARDGSGRAIYRQFLYPLARCTFPVAEKGCAGLIYSSG
jgi:hypothetical protein